MKSKALRQKSTQPPAPQEYLHGFSQQEQDRLYEQAQFLEEFIYKKINFKNVHTLLEVGCGVGAQTQILLKRFPHLKIEAIDSSPTQVARAQIQLNKPIKKKQVRFTCGDASQLPYPNQKFEGAFVCWFLEHVPSPELILKEIARVLKPGATIYCSEVFNNSFYLYPHCPATMKFWSLLNECQIDIQGDPNVGAKLGKLLLESGFKKINIYPIEFHLDARTPEQTNAMLDYFHKLFLSAAPQLLKNKLCDQALITLMNSELKALKNNPQTVFFYTSIQAKAQR